MTSSFPWICNFWLSKVIVLTYSWHIFLHKRSVGPFSFVCSQMHTWEFSSHWNKINTNSGKDHCLGGSSYSVQIASCPSVFFVPSGRGMGSVEQNTSSSSVLTSAAWKPVEKSGRALFVTIASGKVSLGVTSNTVEAIVSSISTAGDSVVAVAARGTSVVTRTAASVVPWKPEVAWGARVVFLKRLGEVGIFLIVVVFTECAAWKNRKQEKSWIRAFTADFGKRQKRSEWKVSI